MEFKRRPASRKGWLLALAAMSLFFVATLPPADASASGGIYVTSLADLTPEQLASALVGGGVEISDVEYKGAETAAGSFTGGTGIIGFESGVILSSGSINNVDGPNREDGITGISNADGDSDLDELNPALQTLDAAVLEFDFISEGDSISFQYVFASDEYNDFVNTAFNDVFGFFLDGENLALVPGTDVAVSINTVNKGRPFGSRKSSSNPEYYINNDLDDGGGALDTEMDGLTTVLSVHAPVEEGKKYHIKLAIADVSDRLVDSNIFIKSGSFKGSNPPIADDDSVITYQNTPVEIDVVINDWDIDGDDLMVSTITQPTSGQSAIESDHTVSYEPNEEFLGTDTFSYAVEDEDGGIGTAQVTVEVIASGGEEGGPTQQIIGVNTDLRVDDLDINYDQNDPRAGSGVYTITATFTNTSSQELSNLSFVVSVITENNLLLNAAGGPGGVGSRLPVPAESLSGGVLDPGESFTQDFEIGVVTVRPFSFFVDVLGAPP